MTATATESMVATYLEADRKVGFTLTEAPLLRMHLIRAKTETMEFIFTHHHLLLDGWSIAIVLKELTALYDSNGSVQLPAVVPYRNYVSWLGKQDHGVARQFWRSRLRGFSEPTPVPYYSMTALPADVADPRYQLQLTVSGHESITGIGSKVWGDYECSAAVGVGICTVSTFARGGCDVWNNIIRKKCV